MELLVATTNKKKLREIKDILKDMDVSLVSFADYPKIPRIVENGETFAENAAKKAVARRQPRRRAKPTDSKRGRTSP